jgi:hypothetical protein
VSNRAVFKSPNNVLERIVIAAQVSHLEIDGNVVLGKLVDDRTIIAGGFIEHVDKKTYPISDRGGWLFPCLCYVWTSFGMPCPMGRRRLWGF